MNELTYEEFTSAIKNLILNATKIYDITFNKIMNLEKENIKDQEKLDEYLNKLEYFKKKEKNILNYIFEKDNHYDEDIYLNQYLFELIDDDNVRSLIYSRLDSCFLEKTEEYLKEIEDEEYREDDFDTENEYFDQIFHYLNLEYLARGLKNIEGKYNFAFTNPKLEDELLTAKYNTNNLIVLPKNLNSKILGIDTETYENFESEVCMECIMDIINQIEDGLEMNEKNNIDTINFFASKLDYNDLKILKDVCIYKIDKSYNSSSEEILINIIKIFNAYIKKIPKQEQNSIVSDELDENEDTISLKEKEIDIIFEFIKNEIKMYDTINNICNNEIENKNDLKLKTNIKQLKKLKNNEEYLITRLVIDTNLKNILKEILDNCLNIFSENKNIENYKTIFDDNKEKSQIIEKRISNLLKDEKPLKASLYVDEKLPTIIENEQYLKALKEYNEYIKNKKPKNIWFKVKYEKIFESPFLLDEFLANNGQLTKNTWYSEDILCDLLNINQNEYYGDKQQILFDLAENIIVDLYTNATKDELTTKEFIESKFNMILLKVITDNLNEELITLLEQDSQYTDEDYKFKKQLSKIFKKNKATKTANKN